ncbi:hypothetical protein LTR54_001545 [Friedmanniomyces endolithicus]|nr:hypothetical protein LTS00_004881 [Friedmanniomyces endolithicus]KAK1018658.1 hypothetical protein LTR54_001545 [Friedmanniomyces endolithicus]
MRCVVLEKVITAIMAEQLSAIAYHDRRLVSQETAVAALRARHATPSEFAVFYASIRSNNYAVESQTAEQTTTTVPGNAALTALLTPPHATDALTVTPSDVWANRNNSAWTWTSKVKPTRANRDFRPISLRKSDPPAHLPATDRPHRPCFFSDSTPQFEDACGALLDECAAAFGRQRMARALQWHGADEMERLVLAAEKAQEGGRPVFGEALAKLVGELEGRQRMVRADTLRDCWGVTVGEIRQAMADLEEALRNVFFATTGRTALVEAAGGMTWLLEGAAAETVKPTKAQKAAAAREKAAAVKKAAAVEKQSAAAAATAPAASRKRKATATTAAVALTELAGAVGGAETVATPAPAPAVQPISRSGRALKRSVRAQEAQDEVEAVAKASPRKRARVAVSPAQEVGELPAPSSAEAGGDVVVGKRRMAVFRVREPAAVIASA